MAHLLIIDDEKNVRESLIVTLKGRYETTTAENGAEGLKLLAEQEPDLVLLDLTMPGMNGLEVLKEAKKTRPRIPVIMLTAVQMVKSAVQAMKSGAADYLTKPFDHEELLLVISNVLSTASLEKKVRLLQSNLNEIHSFEHLIGVSPVMNEIYQKINLLADTKTTVLITGESGTGKELVARALHFNSARRDKPFVALNCAAIPENLIESELFGHERGAFTDAQGKKIGQFEAAHEGSIFLDEIGDLSMTTQAKILRVIQEKEFMRVGGTQLIRSDVRLISATNKDLEQEVRAGRFRNDLYYRIAVVPLSLPPLRERREDISLLVKHFLVKKALEENRPVKEISPDAMSLLTRYDWPGNVRELENNISRIYTLCTDAYITPRDLPDFLKSGQPVIVSRPSDQGSDRVDFEKSVMEFEKELILRALKKNHFVQTKAAQALGISRRMLAYKLQNLGLTIDQLAEENPG